MVIRVIMQRRAEYQQCYTDALGWNPALKGRLLVRLTVESDGQVSAVEEQAPQGEKFPDEVMVACVTEQLKLVRFPASPPSIQTYKITYPLVFTPKSDGPR